MRLTKYRPLSVMAAVQQNRIILPADTARILQHIVRVSIQHLIHEIPIKKLIIIFFHRQFYSACAHYIRAGLQCNRIALQQTCLLYCAIHILDKITFIKRVNALSTCEPSYPDYIRIQLRGRSDILFIRCRSRSKD